jgi:hypothetical protein
MHEPRPSRLSNRRRENPPKKFRGRPMCLTTNATIVFIPSPECNHCGLAHETQACPFREKTDA